jgi:UDP-N-acetylmuramoyl-tripeptide--D-alanyl-D-alanine ligase
MMTLETCLAVLQQSEYDLGRYQEWYKRHEGENLTIKPKKQTLKFQLLYSLASTLAMVQPQQDAIRNALDLLAAPEFVAKSFIIRRAENKLRAMQKHGLVVVAVAGSYAKTSTKHILAQVMGQFVPTLATPDSVNTPIGIALTILNSLRKSHRLFIVEAGAYVRGDVAGLVNFLQPNYGILTPIGIEHLERFGSKENIIAAETELITTREMPVLSHDVNIPIIPDKLKTPNLQFYGFFPKSRYDVSNVKVTKAGTECRLEVDNDEYQLFVPLFGKHNLANMLPSFWLADKFGFPTQKVIETLRTLKPIEHRLQPITTEVGTLILDNGYNTMPDSSKESLRVLKEIPAKRRIIVTPGFVELGKQQAKYNEDLGERMAEVADIVVITGTTNKEALERGLLTAKFAKKNILFADNENDAVAKLGGLLDANTVLLFEGGTPEIYQ